MVRVNILYAKSMMVTPFKSITERYGDVRHRPLAQLACASCQCLVGTRIMFMMKHGHNVGSASSVANSLCSMITKCSSDSTALLIYFSKSCHLKSLTRSYGTKGN